jgi:hypothetical protein
MRTNKRSVRTQKGNKSITDWVLLGQTWADVPCIDIRDDIEDRTYYARVNFDKQLYKGTDAGSHVVTVALR